MLQLVNIPPDGGARLAFGNLDEWAGRGLLTPPYAFREMLDREVERLPATWPAA
jgi:hypothetical protein